MPIDYKKYPKNWKTEIRPRILQRANHCCEFCGVKNNTIGYRDSQGVFYEWKTIEDALENNGYDYFDHELKNCIDKQGCVKKHTKIVLTIAHLDHNINNNTDDNLKALCQRCHLYYDLEHHKRNSNQTRLKKSGKLSLFDNT